MLKFQKVLAELKCFRIFEVSMRHNDKKNTMRSHKVKQLDKINQKIVDINIHLEWLRDNGTEKQVEKVEAREQRLMDRATACAKTMTEEEYDESKFGDIQCMPYEWAIED